MVNNAGDGVNPTFLKLSTSYRSLFAKRSPSSKPKEEVSAWRKVWMFLTKECWGAKRQSYHKARVIR